MRIGILGSGGVGQTLAAGFTAKGHDVMVGTRDPKKTMAETTPNMMGQPPYSAWAKGNPKVRLGTFAEAARHGEVLVLCVHGTAVPEAVRAAGPEAMAGKLVLDTTNPLEFGANGVHKPASVKDSLLQEAQRLAPKAHLVKALNCTPGGQMVDPKFKEGAGDQLICGDDAKAKQQAAAILQGLGWNSLDAGDASVAPYVEGMALACINYAARTQDWTWGVKLVHAT